jgi:hypothetical protein
MDDFKRANMELVTALEVMGSRYVSRRPCNRAKDKRIVARYARRKLREELIVNMHHYDNLSQRY